MNNQQEALLLANSLIYYYSMSDPYLEMDFQDINDELQLKNFAEYISIQIKQSGSQDDKTVKLAIGGWLAKIHAQITNPSNSPKSKFMSLLMLREFTEKHATAERKEDKHNKLFSMLASHALTKEMRNIAAQVDPMKQISEKGKSIFPSNSMVGNDFVRLVLELIRFWASRFPTTSKKEPTTYKRYYDELVDRKVIFPNDYKFLSFANKKNAEEGLYDTGRQKPGFQSQHSSLGAPPLPPPPASSSRSTAKAEIFRMFNRLINFVETLDQQISIVEPEIRTVHNLIKSDQNKYEMMQEEVVESGDEDILGKYFAIINFMQKELQFHKKYISNSNDYQSYIFEIKIEAEKDLLLLNNNQGSAPTPSQQEPPKLNQKASKPKEPPKVSSSIKEPMESEKPPRQSTFDPKTTVQVSSFFNKLQEKSKSPITGFRKINESLSKEKSTTIKRSVSPINVSKNITKSMASLKESKISPIFANPPNLRPPPKSYEGREIRENDAIGTFLRAISKSQGLRRFKTANFKGKSSLFENEHLQIGYKSQAIYEQVSGFKVMIKVELYFGNLTDQRVSNLSLQFKGDPNLLLYANPRAIETSLLRGDQNKIDLMIVPIKVPFPLLAMTMRYDIRGEPFDHRVIIPNSVLKLAHYMNIPKADFARRWQTADILHTSETKLCHYLPPDTFTKWIPELSELTSYTAFAIPGSIKDYELYCAVIMLQRHEALLKINVRPNLQVVIELGLEDRNQESTQYFTYFLETLQQLLKQVA